MDIDLEKVESLLKLMQTYKIDCIQVGELKLLKTKHEIPQNKDNTASKKGVFSDEELLFHSTTNALTLQQIEELEAGRLVLNPTKGK